MKGPLSVSHVLSCTYLPALGHQPSKIRLKMGPARVTQRVWQRDSSAACSVGFVTPCSRLHGAAFSRSERSMSERPPSRRPHHVLNSDDQSMLLGALASGSHRARGTSRKVSKDERARQCDRRYAAGRDSAGAAAAGDPMRLSCAPPQTKLVDSGAAIIDETESSKLGIGSSRLAAGLHAEGLLFAKRQTMAASRSLLRDRVDDVVDTPVALDVSNTSERAHKELGHVAAGRNGEQRAELQQQQQEQVSQKEALGRGRQLITKLKALGQTGEWERALEVLRTQVTQAKRSRDLARARGEQPSPSCPLLTLEGVAYNATLSALSKAGRWKEALQLMSEMKIRGLPRDTITFASAIAACGRGKQCSRALDLLAEMRREGVPANSFVYCSAIDACAKGGEWNTALVLLQEMEDLDHLAPNRHCINSAIDACAKAGRQGEALAMLARMRRVGVKPNQVSYLGAISACARAADAAGALRLLADMKDDGLEADLKCYSSVIAAYGNGGRWIQAVGVLEEMRTLGVEPNRICYNAAIAACAKGKQWKHAVRFLDTMRHRGISPDIISYNSAIDACSKSGRWSEALQMFLHMRNAADASDNPEAGSPLPPLPDATTYGAAITACSRGKQWQLALHLLNDMETKGVKRTESVFQATMAACARIGRWRECMVILDKMQQSGLEPQVVAYNSVITACGRGGQWRRGLAVMTLMLTSGVTPDVITFNAAMSGCAQAGRFQEARGLLELMRDPDSKAGASFADLAKLHDRNEELRLQRLVPGIGGHRDGALRRGRSNDGQSWPPRPDGVGFHVVTKALAAAGMWAQALEVLDEMRQEREQMLSLRYGSVSTNDKHHWHVDMDRFRSVFRRSEGGNVDRSTRDEACRRQGMLLLAKIEETERAARSQMSSRSSRRTMSRPNVGIGAG